MKKLITILTLSLTILTLSTALIPSPIQASQTVLTGTQYNKVCYTSQSILNTSSALYNTTIIDEDGEAYIMLTTHKLPVNTWLDVNFSNQSTPDQKDDIIVNFNLLLDNQ